MDERFLRNEMMLGPEAVEKLASAHVCVFGLGGVGSYVVEGLARSGVGELTLIITGYAHLCTALLLL